MNKIEIEVPDGKKAEWVNDVLTLVDDKPKDVRERIKTFNDARKELGEDHQFVQEWKMIRKTLAPDLEAYMRLRIITAVLNEGWEPKFIPGEYRWAPYFLLYTKEDIDKMKAEIKARVAFRSSDGASADGGVSFAYACNGSAYVAANIGSRLAFKSEELAEYAGNQFLEIYAEFYFKSKDK